MTQEKILIVGAGVAGSILAFWLAKFDFDVTVIERSRAEQKLGQGIEIEEPALQVVKAMGILDKLQEVKTAEEGFHLVDEQARSRGFVPIGGFGPTGALELMRGDFTEVLYKAADAFENVTYRFETTISSMRQTGEKVVVEIQRRNEKQVSMEEFDLVVGADGARSQMRNMLMGSSIDCYKPVGAFVAYFSIPKEDQDWPNSKLCQFPGRRVLWLRPTQKDSKETSVYLIHIKDDVPALHEANAAGNRTKQKEAFAELFSGLGWESDRVVQQMLNSENFYSDELVQVKIPKWSQDRVVLLGDAAWSPTPFTGQGNQLAIIGAWVLAQELSRNRNSLAFENYEKRLRNYVEESQQIPLGGRAPYLCCPETRLGIWVFRTLFRIFSWTVKILSGIGLISILPDRDHQSDVFDLQMESTATKAST